MKRVRSPVAGADCGAGILRIALVVCLAAGVGCQTARSFEHGCPGVYSGVRFFNDQIREIPPDGKLFFAVDLPLSAIFDTLLLPVTSFVDRQPPEGGYPPGCRWARRH